MNTTLLDSAYGSLELLIEQLLVMPEITASPEATRKLQNAMLFHREIGAQHQHLLDGLNELTNKTATSTQETLRDEQDSVKVDAEKYILMRDNGSDHKQVCLKAKEEGMNSLQRIKLLRTVFGLTLEEALEIENLSSKMRPL